MKILLDECIDWRLARDLDGHDVSTVRRMAWTSFTNGALLRRAAEGGFEVFITVDGHLSQQQNLSVVPLIVVVLKTRMIRLRDLRPLVPKALAAVAIALPGSVLEIS